MDLAFSNRLSFIAGFLFLACGAIAFFTSNIALAVLVLTLVVGTYYYSAIDKTELLLYPIIAGIFLEAILEVFQEGALPFTLFQLILIASLTIFFLVKIAKRDLNIYVSHYTIPVLLFLAIISFSLIYSEDRQTGTFNLIRFTVLVIFVGFLVNFIGQQKTIIRGLILASFICVVLAIYSIFEGILNPQIAINNLTSGGLVKGRAAAGGIYTDPNRFAASLFLPLAFGFSLMSSRIDFKYRVIGLIVFMIVLGGIVSTYSRSGFLGVILICFLSIFFFNRVRPLLLVGIVAISVVLVIPDLRIALFSYTERIFGILSGNIDTSSNIRLMLGWGGLRMFFDSYLLGVGFESFNIDFARYYTSQQTVTVMEPHNITYEVLAELGLHGFLVFAALIWFLLRDGYKNIKNSLNVEDKIISVTLFSSFCAFLLFYQLYGGALYDTVWLLVIGLMLTQKKILRKDREMQQSSG